VFRVAPTIGFRLDGNTCTFLRRQALYGEDFLFVVGGGLSGMRWILERSLPMLFPTESFGFYPTAGTRFD
jgi:hypothetical protein